jgi:hypothetical protein
MDVEGGAESAGFPMEDIADLLMPRRWYLNAIYPQGTRPTDDVIKEVTKRATQYYALVAERKTEGRYGFKDAMELYETFHWLRRQRTYGQYPLGCTCRTCCSSCLCWHSALVTSLLRSPCKYPPTGLRPLLPSARRPTTCGDQPAPGERAISRTSPRRRRSQLRSCRIWTLPYHLRLSRLFMEPASLDSSYHLRSHFLRHRRPLWRMRY